MGEFLAEADVLIRPDTSKFRATLLAELEAATKGIVVPITVVASQQSLTRAKEVARTTGTVTKAKQEQALADQSAARAAVQLAEAQRLGAIASERLRAIENAEALSVSATAGAKAKLRAATIAVTAARKAEAAALQIENEELAVNAQANLASAEAQLAEARAAATAAVAHARGAAATAAHAAQEHALVSGARAAGASLTGLRGATLSTSGAFLAGAIAVKLFEEAVHEASAEAEASARAEKVFGDQAHELEKDARGLADSFGLSTRQALVFEGRLGTLFKNAGIATEESAHLSETLTKLAGDLAAFNNVPTEKVLNAIALALVGNSRGLRQFGIELNQARVNQIALRESGKENVKQLSQEDRIRARINLLTQQSTQAQGAAARRADSLAQSEKNAKAELENLGGTIGRAVIPKVTELIGDFTQLVSVLNKVTSAAEHFKIPGLDAAPVRFLEKLEKFALADPFEKFKTAKGIFDNIRDVFKDQNRDFKDLNFQGEKFSGTMQELHAEAERLFAIKSIDELNATLSKSIELTKDLITKAANVSFDRAVRDVARLDEKLSDATIAGGGKLDQAAQLDILQQRAAAQQRAIDAATLAASSTAGRSGHHTAVKRRRQAKEDLASTLEEIQGIREDQAKAIQDTIDRINQIVADAKQKAEQAIQDANDSLLAIIDDLTKPLDFEQARSAATKSLVDDVKFQEDLQRVILQQIAVAKKIVGNEKLRADTLHELRVALLQSQIEEKALRQQQAKNAAERKAAKFNREAESIDLDIELAQTNKNVRAEIRAREARIRLDQERLKSVKGDILATKRLRNDIAAQRAAIKELKGEVDKRRKDLEALEFSFLQTQAGFAGTLLSNLLPSGSVAGTVGGGGISTKTTATEAVPPADFARAAHQRPVSQDVTRGAQTAAGGPRGATSGQASVQITLLRGILSAVTRLGGQRAAPESTEHRIRQAASMDIF